MTRPPEHDDHVPAHVLDELSAAFAEPGGPSAGADTAAHDAPSGEAPVYDFDDPNLDSLLGISGPHPVPASPAASPAGPPPTPAPTPTPNPTKTPEPGGPRRIIVIDEADLPDAVYLDEEAEHRLREVHSPADPSEPVTIVIGDADDGAPIEQVPTTSRPTIDPRVRARRIAVGRAKGRKRLVVVALIVGALGLVVAGLAVAGSSWFGVRDIRVQGASYSKAQVAALVAKVEGEPVLLLDTTALERDLESIPWVEAAKVSTDFPRGLHVDVRERVPVAYFTGSDGQFRVIDRDARVLTVLKGVPVRYPSITGPAPDVAAGAFAGDLYAGAADVVLSLPPELRAQLATVGVDSSAGVLSMRLRSGTVVSLGPPQDLTRKLARLLIVLRQSAAKKCATIDVSSGDASTC